MGFCLISMTNKNITNKLTWPKKLGIAALILILGPGMSLTAGKLIGNNNYAPPIAEKITQNNSQNYQEYSPSDLGGYNSGR